MKRSCLILTVFAVVCVLFLQAGCQEQAKGAEESKPALTAPSEPMSEPAKAKSLADTNELGPEIKFEKLVHDFGKVGPETRNLCEFKFTNTGKGLLKITDVSKTCGCTPYTLEKKEYAAGESGTLEVKYYSSNRPGEVSKELTVFSNDKAHPQVTLKIKANIALKVVCEPAALDLLLKAENAGCPKITLRSLDGKRFAIESFKSTSDCITADVNSSVEAVSFVLEPKVDMGKMPKSLSGNVDIELSHPDCRLITIPFNVLPRFKVSPPSVIVFNVEPQKPITKEVWILNNYDEDFEVESSSSEKGFVKGLSQEKIGNRYKLELEIMPPSPDGKQKFFRDVFFVNIKSGERLEVPCNGFYPRK
jgi:hypothetical protein